jgi:hypothetical protein
MRSERLGAVLVALALGVGGCASYELVELPLRQADLYPQAQKREGVSVAVQAFTDPFRVRSYFGTNLLEYNIVPVEFIVSNHGSQNVRFEPADVLVTSSDEVIDPLPVEVVAELPIRDHIFVRDSTREQLKAFYAELALREGALAPGGNTHGVLFFRIPEPRSRIERYFHVWKPFPAPTLQVYCALSLEQGKRVRFGPFSLFR